MNVKLYNNEKTLPFMLCDIWKMRFNNSNCFHLFNCIVYNQALSSCALNDTFQLFK